MVSFPQGGWEGAAEVGMKSNTSHGGERDVQGSEQHIHLLQLQLGIAIVAGGSFESLLHKIQEVFAAAEIPTVTRAESEIPTLPFLSLVLSQTCISHIPFLARKGFACTENCISFT